MQPSITLNPSNASRYLLRIGDSCLIHAQRLSEWCGHGPILEEDIALTNIALDLIGQARAVLDLVARREGSEAGEALDEDRLAFLRAEHDFLNLTLVELPRGDFAFTMIRIAMFAQYMSQTWTALVNSRDDELAGIAGKAVKESRYHYRHAADWVVRLGDGTQESHRRAQQALDRLWRYGNECFADDDVDEQAESSGLGPRRGALRGEWQAEMEHLMNEATLVIPKDSAFVSTGTQGRHSESMGHLLSEMQYLQRAYPGGVW